MLGPALQEVWSSTYSGLGTVQFIFVALKPDTFAALQNNIISSGTIGSGTPDPSIYEKYHLTRIEYPIVLRENGDWAQYIDQYKTNPFPPPATQPATPGIAIIDQQGNFYAIRYGDYDENAGVTWATTKINELLGLQPGPRLPSPLINIIYGLQEWAIPRWIRVAYLILNLRSKDMPQAISPPSASFNRVVAKYLDAYVKEGTMPPADIAPAILNLADDYLAGRTMNLRAGDYIAIQNHIRKGRG